MRKRIAFLTLYDTICYGTRLLASLANEHGCEPHLIHLKRETYLPIFKRKDEYQTYQFHYNGLMRGSCYAVDYITQTEVKLLLDLLESISPSIIGLSTRSFAYKICKDLLPQIKKRLPSVSIMAGGWGPTLEPEKFSEFCDFVCWGEGEKTIGFVCDAVKEGKDFSGAPNLVFRKNGEMVWNTISPTLSIQALNELPFPDFSIANKYLISDNRLQMGRDFYNERVYDLFSARGCPMSCTYCLSSKYSNIYKKHSGKACPKYRLRDIGIVLKEARAAKERGAQYIRFKDEVFPLSAAWLKEFIERYPNEINLPFFAHIRPEFHDVETIKKLGKIGLSVTIVGIQSGSHEIRKNVYRRKLPEQQVIEFARTLDSLDVQFIYHFIYRNPFERENHLSESLEFTYQLPYRKAFLFKLEPFPDTPLKERIDSESPIPIPTCIADWYAILHCMSLNGPWLRRIAKVVFKNKLFRKFPFVLGIFFVPSLIKEGYAMIENKYRVKAPFNYFRLKKQ